MADLICDEVLTVEQETSEHLQSENEMSNMGKSIKVHLFREGRKFYLLNVKLARRFCQFLASKIKS